MRDGSKNTAFDDIYSKANSIRSKREENIANMRMKIDTYQKNGYHGE